MLCYIEKIFPAVENEEFFIFFKLNYRRLGKVSGSAKPVQNFRLIALKAKIPCTVHILLFLHLVCIFVP